MYNEVRNVGYGIGWQELQVKKIKRRSKMKFTYEMPVKVLMGRNVVSEHKEEFEKYGK